MSVIDHLYNFLLPHIVAGVVALLAFWVAALSRKGSRPHRFAGRVHLLAILMVVLTALPLTLVALLRGNLVTAAFLSFLVVLVSHNSLVAWRAVRLKRNFDRFINLTYRVGALLTGLAGLGVIVLGAIHGSVILLAFGAVGPLAAFGSVRMIRDPAPPANWWLREHLGAMIGNGIAVHIAFLQIGLGRWLRGLDYNVIIQLSWLLPLFAGVVAGLWMSRKWLSNKPGRGGQVIARG